MAIFKIINDYLKLIREGKSMRDKLVILSYFLKIPFRSFNKFFGKKVKYDLSSNIKIENREGIFFCGKNIFFVWTASSFYEKDIKKYFDLSEGTFIDIGANMGKYSVILGKKLNKTGLVLAIEPEAKNFEILKKNLELNKLNNVLPIKKGCFSKKQKLKFYLDEVGVGGHSLIKETKKFVEIEVDTLDNIVKENKIKNIKLMKIDVEGAEADVLIGAKEVLKKYHPKIIFEAWNDEHFKKIKIILDKYKYQYKKIGSQDYIAF